MNQKKIPRRLSELFDVWRRQVSLVAFTAIFWHSLPAAAADCGSDERRAADSNYRQGIAEYRGGRPDAAYPLLLAALKSCPEDRSYRNDLIVAAVAAGHPDTALGIGTPLDPIGLPTYVLEALARAARDLHEAQLAIRYYDVILGKGENIGARVGRNLALIDAGEAAQAQRELLALNERYPNRTDILEAQGLADEALGEVIAALAAAEQALRVDAHYEGALQLRFRLLLAGGAPQLALSLTPERLLTPAQRGAALHDLLALEYRWARDEPGNAKGRAKRLDAVITRMRAGASDASIYADSRAGLRRDLVEALAQRGRCAEAVSEYESLQAEGLAIPPYVTAAAIGAYLTQRQPQRSVALFRALPKDYRPPSGVRVNYFYALIESGQYDAAIDWADRILVETPRQNDSGSPELRADNEQYTSALVLTALARGYTDRLADAEARLDALIAEAPANTEALLALAETDGLRGRPRAASEIAVEILRENPDSGEALSKLFDDSLQMNDLRAARDALNRLVDVEPADDASLRRAERDWRTQTGAFINLEGQIGRSYGGRAGVVDSTVDEYGYSPVLGSAYRLFVHLNQGEGTPVQGDTYRHAVGAGLEYHTQDWRASAELLDIDGSGPAPQLNVEATPDDYWRIGASYALRTLDIPIAAVVVGVHADRSALSLDYRASESREIGAQADHEQFSDGNSRAEALMFWRERWIAGPIYKLDSRVDLNASSNTLADTNYFNPKRDLTGTLTLQNQWLQYRRYDRALSHELDLGLGEYAQQGYSAGLIASFRYQLVYDANDHLSLRAGLGRTIRPYDGARERLDILIFSVLGRF
ncbi:MAG TPA: poly-beta-1,6 N-acetyl-D-glucosamine export porin PgaA [Steroidobacteraceae bacterium]|nr:poly-beta-1,6 N-acetyl-D-glucosamine export porin PgaA [Steroidobacteraceae bacterium]